MCQLRFFFLAEETEVAKFVVEFRLRISLWRQCFSVVSASLFEGVVFIIVYLHHCLTLHGSISFDWAGGSERRIQFLRMVF